MKWNEIEQAFERFYCLNYNYTEAGTDVEYALWDNKTHAYSDVKEKAVYLQAGDDINYLSYKWSKKDNDWNLLLEHANPLVKVTIVPRGKALGAAWYLPEERQITTREQLQDEMCATLGGRAAEELVLGKISTGASNDLERVTKQAYAMVVYFGMSDKLPNLNYYDSTGQDWGFTKPYSEETAKLIDTEVQKIINEQYDRAKRILSENKEGHSKLAQVLLDREVIYSEDVEHIFGKRAWISRSQEILELQEKANGKNKENADKEAEADATTENVTDTPTEENKTGKIA